MKNKKDIQFECTRCGQCCKNIGGFKNLSNFDNGSGVCIHLTIDNLCDIYAERPIWCNVKKLYSEMFTSIMTEEEWYQSNKSICEKLELINR